MEWNLTDAELKIMTVLWEQGDTNAKDIYEALRDETGWSINTTYTLIKRCISKGAIRRSEPKFRCHALVERTQVQESETENLIDKLFNGSADKLFAALVSGNRVSREQLRKLRDLVDELE